MLVSRQGCSCGRAPRPRCSPTPAAADRAGRPQPQRQRSSSGASRSSRSSSSRSSSSSSSSSRCRLCALPDSLDVEQVADMIAAQPLNDKQKGSLEVLTNTLGVPLGTAKAMVFKKRGVAGLSAGELLDRVRCVADVVGVTTDQAIEMVTIQPGLLFDTQRNADALSMGIRAICYELNAPKEEVVELILKNQSVLHGREMHLSVADIAHLAMLREPGGRIAE